MSTVEVTKRSPSTTRPRRRHPHPGESIPAFAWPTVLMALGAVAVFALSTLAAIGGVVPAWVTISLNAAVAFTMFVVAHEGLHWSISTKRWVNEVIGRVAWFFVVPMVSLSSYRYLHLQHHRHANDERNDPDVFATHRPAWQMPFRWAFMEIFYAAWYIGRLPERLRHNWRRPAAEIGEGAVVFCLYVGGIGAAILTGHLGIVAVTVLIPQRLGVMILGWWFDWLPHHGLEHTQREDRYRASRIRLGMEWVLIPLMLSQNYHLVHHLHPWIPFYRYRQAWDRNEAAYLEHGAAATTVFGRRLNPGEVRERRSRPE
jgi:fatty acid desaturase